MDVKSIPIDIWNNGLNEDPWNGEPVSVANKFCNSAVLTLDATPVSASDKPSNIILNNQSYSGVSGFASNQSRKLTPRYVEYYDTIPNINPRNNIYTINYNGTDFQFTMNIGFYESPGAIVAELINKINVATSVVFSSAVILNTGGLYYRIAAPNPADTWYWVNDAHLQKARYLFGPDTDPTPYLYRRIGPVLGIYTRYFTITSNSITQYSKIKNINTKDGKSNAIATIFTKRFDSTTHYPGDKIDYPITIPASINLRKDASLTSIDIQLIDEWGEYLYVENELINVTIAGYEANLARQTINPFTYFINIVMEL